MTTDLQQAGLNILARNKPRDARKTIQVDLTDEERAQGYIAAFEKEGGDTERLLIHE